MHSKATAQRNLGSPGLAHLYPFTPMPLLFAVEDCLEGHPTSIHSSTLHLTLCDPWLASVWSCHAWQSTFCLYPSPRNLQLQGERFGKDEAWGSHCFRKRRLRSPQEVVIQHRGAPLCSRSCLAVGRAGSDTLAPRQLIRHGLTWLVFISHNCLWESRESQVPNVRGKRLWRASFCGCHWQHLLSGFSTPAVWKLIQREWIWAWQMLSSGRGRYGTARDIPLECTLTTENARTEMNSKYHGLANSLLHSSLNSQHRVQCLSQNRHSINISKIMNSVGDSICSSCWIQMWELTPLKRKLATSQDL